MTVDPRAAAGFAEVADAYQRGRPSYPAQAIEAIVDALCLGETSAVLDLAAGTGKLARLLQPRVNEVIAVEPAAAMRVKLAADLPGALVLDGIAEAIPLPDESVDAVLVGEAFHWFRTTEAAREIARVLTERGGLALLWNVPTWTTEDTPWLAAFRQIVEPHERAAGPYPAGDARWQSPLHRTRLFDTLTYVEAAHVQCLSPDGFLAQVASRSWIANLAPERRRAVLTDVETLVRQQPEISIAYRTDLYWTRCRTTAPPTAEVRS